MSLRYLFEGKKNTSLQQSKNNSALVFVLNENYVPGLRVLLYSMYANKTLLDLPIIIITEQQEIFRDAVICRAVDHRRVISSDEIELFKNISAAKVATRLKLSWIPKYTYLKWLMFDDYGYDRLIFIDADIVCMKPIDELVSMEGADLFGCPMFDRSLRSPRLDRETVSDNILLFSTSERPNSRRLNTGVLVIGDRLLSEAFRSDLIGFAETEEFAVEQAALRQFLYKTRRGVIRMISPLYNFKAPLLESVAAHRRFDLVDKIRLLHFAGVAVRPWQKRAPETTSDFIWFCYAKEAERTYEEIN